MVNKLVEAIDIRVWFPVRIGFLKRIYAKAVDGVSISIKQGETLALVGESGCGKTTLGRALLKLVPLTSGKLIFDGKDITNLSEDELKWFRKEAQMIFQDPYSSLAPTMTIFKILEEPLLVHGFKDRNERFELIYKVLQDVKLTPPEEFLMKYPHQLSGGQRQRVAIARALILKPRLIVADEPTSNLDVSVQARILNLLMKLRDEFKLTYIFITHNLAVAYQVCNRIAVMYLGKIVEIGDVESIIHNPQHPYTKALLSVTPIPDPEVSRSRIKIKIKGEPPNPINPPSGCRFHPRCPYAMDKCTKEEPPEIEVEKGHIVKCWLFAKK